MKELRSLVNEVGLEWVSKIYYIGLKENIGIKLNNLEGKFKKEELRKITDDAMDFLFFENKETLFILDAKKFIKKSDSAHLLENFPRKMLGEILCFGSVSGTPGKISVLLDEKNGRRIVMLRNTVLFKSIFEQVVLKREELDKIKLIFDATLENEIVEKEFINELKKIENIIDDSGVLIELEEKMRDFLGEWIKKIANEKGMNIEI